MIISIPQFSLQLYLYPPPNQCESIQVDAGVIVISPPPPCPYPALHFSKITSNFNLILPIFA